MHVTALEEYSLRCAIQLARHYPEGPLSATQLAELEGISPQYVGKILFLFKKAGLVTSSRGTKGGFILTKDPSLISLASFLKNIPHQKKPLTPLTWMQFCQQYRGKEENCTHLSTCSIRALWFLSQSFLFQVYSKITLADFLQSEKNLFHKLQKIFFEVAQKQWAHPQQKEEALS